MTAMLGAVGSTIIPNQNLSYESMSKIYEIVQKSESSQQEVNLWNSTDETSNVIDFAKRVLQKNVKVTRVGPHIFLKIVKEPENNHIVDVPRPLDYATATRVVKTLDLPNSTMELVLEKLRDGVERAKGPISDKKATVVVWKDRKNEDKVLTPPQFIAKYYPNEIADRTLTQAFVRRVDPSLYWAYHNWRRVQANREIEIGFEFPSANSIRDTGSEDTAKVGWQDQVSASPRSPDQSPG